MTTGLIIVFLAILHVCSGGRVCSSCRDVEGGQACSQYTTCTDNEVCFMQHFSTDEGKDLYNFGCGIKQACPTSPGVFVGKRSGGFHRLCYKCCNGTDLCNQFLTCDKTTPQPGQQMPSECSDITPTIKTSGVYTIYPFGVVERPVQVNCIVDGMNRIWTVIQQRSNGSVNFYRDWASYKNGFGDPHGEYWLGNNAIHLISSTHHHELMINMSDFDNVHRYAEYSTFHIGDEANGYKLFVTGYSGDAGDDITNPSSGCEFSTYDRDNDIHNGDNCAVLFTGAWWYNDCMNCDLNGEYLYGKHDKFAHGVMWYSFRGYHYSLRSTIMMIRKRNN